MKFILNDQDISTDQPTGSTVLDFVRYHKDLKGTKIGCREGDCGACTVLVGELIDEKVRYRSMTSCLMPLANAAGKHIVTVEGINPENRGLTPVQQAMVDESGTQCGFCTVGFVMSLTGFCVDGTAKTPEMAVSAIDGNICRCTGYKSIERAAERICEQLSEPPTPLLPEEGWQPLWGDGVEGVVGGTNIAIENSMVPKYFGDIAVRLHDLAKAGLVHEPSPSRPLTQAVLTGGGTDLYVQRHDAMTEADSIHLFDDLRGIRDTGTYIEIGASATVTDLLESPLMHEIFPDLYKHLKLVSSTPIRNMATLAGNFVNASPIGDMTVWFLALDGEITLSSPPYQGGVDAGSGRQSPSSAKAAADGVVLSRDIKLRDLYLGYKQLAKSPEECITAIRFKKPTGDFRFNFEKVCKRTYLDIATVNAAISLEIESKPGAAWIPPVLRGELPESSDSSEIDYTIKAAHVAAGGVSPIPLYLRKTSEFLVGNTINEETIAAANEIIQSEISPISDVRGTEQYKRLLLRQLFKAHFIELFATEFKETTE